MHTEGTINGTLTFRRPAVAPPPLPPLAARLTQLSHTIMLWTFPSWHHSLRLNL